jgi:hypothetical protein
MKKYLLTLDLQTFADGPTPEDSPSVEVEGQEPSDPGTAPESNPEEPTNPSDEDITKQESFAKRLKESSDKAIAEERKKWEAEIGEKYKDHDIAKQSMEFLKRMNKIDDPMTLKEQIELAELQDKAKKENLTVEELQRRQRLEDLEAWQEKTLKDQQESEQYKTFRTSIEEFAKENDADADALEKYMYEEQIGSPKAALNAMKAEEYKLKAEEREADVIKRYVESKKAPKAEGAGAAGTVTETPKTWEDSRKAALSRFRAANTAE